MASSSSSERASGGGAADPRGFLDEYFQRLQRAATLDAPRRGQLLAVRDLWLAAREAGGRVHFVGNGGSAAIASHLAIDLAKNAGIPALCYNDAAQITCLANDYGYDQWVRHALRLHARAGDVLVAISSSGKSANILNGAAQARAMGVGLVTLSGMAADNPLRLAGEAAPGGVALWLDSRAYNIIETIHQFWLMSVVDLIIGRAEYAAS